MSLADIIEDEVRLDNLFTNLMMIKATRLAMGDKLLYDKHAMGLNVKDLAQKSIENIPIPVERNGMEPIGNLFQIVPEKDLPPSVLGMVDRAEQRARNATSIDTMQQGVASSSVGTATEASILDKYSSISQAYEENVIGWGRFDFAWLYMVWQTYHMDNKTQKFIKVGQNR